MEVSSRLISVVTLHSEEERREFDDTLVNVRIQEFDQYIKSIEKYSEFRSLSKSGKMEFEPGTKMHRLSQMVISPYSETWRSVCSYATLNSMKELETSPRDIIDFAVANMEIKNPCVNCKMEGQCDPYMKFICSGKSYYHMKDYMAYHFPEFLGFMYTKYRTKLLGDEKERKDN